jgi:MipA family protein
MKKMGESGSVARLKKQGLIVMLAMAAVCFFTAAHGSEETVANSEKLPLYEYGLVGMGARMPHYIGSDEYHLYVFPLPYLIYRGDILQANRDGVRTIFWHNKNIEMDISFSGNPPADDNKAREGMTDLDAIGETGPALNYYFFNYGERDAFLLQASVRAAFAIGYDGGLDISHKGYVSDLSIIYKNSQIFSRQQTRFNVSAGLRFGDSDMHEYFYGVASHDVAPGRQQYEADSGYGGFQVSGNIIKDLTPTYALSGYARWNNVDGAVFEDSPLVRTQNNLMVAAMLICRIGASEEFAK